MKQTKLSEREIQTASLIFVIVGGIIFIPTFLIFGSIGIILGAVMGAVAGEIGYYNLNGKIYSYHHWTNEEKDIFAIFDDLTK